jgi:hypothetical protein
MKASSTCGSELENHDKDADLQYYQLEILEESNN